MKKRRKRSDWSKYSHKLVKIQGEIPTKVKQDDANFKFKDGSTLSIKYDDIHAQVTAQEMRVALLNVWTLFNQFINQQKKVME